MGEKLVFHFSSTQIQQYIQQYDQVGMEASKQQATIDQVLDCDDQHQIILPSTQTNNITHTSASTPNSIVHCYFVSFFSAADPDKIITIITIIIIMLIDNK